jgi:hypothetical protein
MTPHILTRKTRLRPRNFLINDANGLLQQYPPNTGHIAAPQRTDAKGPIAVNDEENDTGGLLILRSKN